MAKSVEENQAKDRFLTFLRESRGEVWNVHDEDVVVDRSTGRNFDYLLGSGEKRIALEIFRLVESEAELARQRKWSDVVDALKSEMTRRSIKDFSIRIPAHFSVTRAAFDSTIKQLADEMQKAIEEHPDSPEFEAGGFTFGKFEGLGQIVFTAMWGGAIDPTGRAYAALLEKLPAKNAQLDVSGPERLVLILNWTHFVGSEEFTEACSQVEFESLPNIDRIYFEPTEGKIIHVFDRALFAAFQKLESPPDHLEPLFLCWLGHRLTRRDWNSFNLVRVLSDKRSSVQWMPPPVRQHVVMFGEDLAKAGNWEDVLWTVQAFKNDPDGDEEDGEKAKGDEYAARTSVRSRACWLLQRIVVEAKKDLYADVFQIIKTYATGKNLFTRRECTVPLIGLARRRRERQPNGNAFMSPELSGAIKELALRMLQENAEFPQILNRMVCVFSWIRDLEEEEAEKVLVALLQAGEVLAQQSVCEMMVYYALYRDQEFTEQGSFDTSRFRRLLEEQIIRGSSSIRTNTIWVIQKMLEERPSEFARLWPYVAMLTEGAFDSGAFFHLHRIAVKFRAQHLDKIEPVLERANLLAKQAPEQSSQE